MRCRDTQILYRPYAVDTGRCVCTSVARRQIQWSRYLSRLYGGRYVGRWKGNDLWSGTEYDKDEEVVRTWLEGVEKEEQDTDMKRLSILFSLIMGLCLSQTALPSEVIGVVDEPFEYVDLSGENLTGADLSGANLYWAKLIRADLSGANLSGADLGWIELKGGARI